MQKENKKLRVFIAIDFAEDVKNKILELINHTEQNLGKIKWVKKDNIHITLKFLGYVHQDKIKDISCKLKKIASNIRPFKISLSDIGIFPNNRYPKIIWIGISDIDEKLEILSSKLNIELQTLDFKKEERKFHPHITIGRVKNIKDKIAFADYLRDVEFHSKTININEIFLYKSTLTAKGPIYSVISKHNLKDN